MSLDVYLYDAEDSPILEISRKALMYSANITHNLASMAAEADLYEAMWQPAEIGASHASDLIAPLRRGLAVLESDRGRFEQLNPANGWGDYELLVRFTRGYLAACEQHPRAAVKVSR